MTIKLQAVDNTCVTTWGHIFLFSFAKTYKVAEDTYPPVTKGWTANASCAMMVKHVEATNRSTCFAIELVVPWFQTAAVHPVKTTANVLALG